MKRTHVHRMVAVALGLLVVGLVVLGLSGEAHGFLSKEGSGIAIQSAPGPVTPTATPQTAITMAPGTVAVEKDVESAVRQALAHALDTVPPADYYAITDVREADNWLFVSVVGLKGLSAALGWNLLDNASWFGVVLLHQDKDGRWAGAVEGTTEFSLLLADVPEKILSNTAKQSLDPLQRRLLITISASRFPWQSGTKMQYGILGVHDNGFSSVVSGWKAVDFLSDGNTGAGHAPNRLLAAATGSIGYVCNDGTSAAIRIGDLFYTHLLYNGNLYTGKSFSQGDEIGQLRPGSFSGTCGYAYQGADWFHVHWGFPNTGSFQVKDWTLSLADGQWRRGGETRGVLSWFQADGGTPPPPCPSSGGVILYKDWHYDCGGDGEGSGYVRRDGTGWQNVGGEFDNRASSVRVPSGWSVKLFEHPDRGGAWACRTGDDDNFGGDKFNNSDVGLNDNVSSFEVFSTPDCGYVPPCPAPRLHAHDYIFTDRTITFRWDDVSCQHNGFTFRVKTVPDMDSGGETVVDTGEGSTQRTVTFDSRWDNRNLYWSVRAANAPGGASWAAARVFRISPNAPPVISFDTANGSSASRIESRERNWTFRGTASDPEGRLDRVEFRCDGDNCGSYHSRSGLGNWTYERHNMAGRNDVYFVAHDIQGLNAASRHLDLHIDLAAPNTTLSLNNEANPANWPAWFRGSVQVRLKATDGNTGRARSGVKEIHYRLDGGGWQTRGGDTVAFTVSSDGTHTVECYAVDNVGNQESTRGATFKIDQTPPSPPGGVSETHGVISNQWQKEHNTPTFTWQPSTDITSGVWGYQFYFGTNPNGVAYQTFRASDPREWTPQPGGVRTDTYYLRGRTRDNADNWSAWTDLFTFRYDGTPPENPGEATHDDERITNDTWQPITSQADFDWPVPHDEGSDIKGYYVYWGDDETGESDNFIAAPAHSFQSATPLCGENEACTGYLRLRSVDKVDNQAEEWSTAFVLRYDNAPPTVDFTINGGVTQTTQTLVTLHIAANDEGSGVRTMRLSSNGEDWTDWEVYSTKRLWTIPAISRQWWPVYLQVRDGVELESPVVMHEIYLDVNPQQPRSESFRLFDHTMSAGAEKHTSSPSGYTGHSTVGQVVDSARANSLNYVIVGGYEAGSQAIPTEEIFHDEFTFINGIFASGTGADTLSSPLYEMRGTLGEVGLPNNETMLNSGGFQHQPGFLAAAPPSGTPTPTPTPGPTPTPTPTPACEFPQISINDGALFTNAPDVTLSICAPYAAEMMLSNDGGFGDAEWEPYAESKAWRLTTYGQYVLPRFVYAAFKDTDGTTHGTYFDDIIHDPNPPEGSIAVGDSVPSTLHATRTTQHAGQPVALLSTRADGTVDLFINAQDDNSGLTEMQISASATFTDTTWESYSALKPWTPEGGDGIKTVYARFRDGADNVSDVTDASFALDTLPPFGGIFIAGRVAGPDVITTTVYLGAEDNLSGVTDLRISADPDFTDAPWQPYTTTLTWPISLTAQSEGTLYVQYRDLAGNASEVYSDTYAVDTTPPVLYVEVEPGDTLTRDVTVLAYDELAAVETMHLSNDPLMIGGVVTLPYSDTVEWAFDERRVVWVQVEDSVGNVSEPYPASMPVAGLADLDGNCVVDVADIMLVANCWRCKCGNPCYDPRYDLDHDCDIDVVDIMMVAAHWGESCGG